MKTVQLRLRSWGYWIMGKDDAQTKGIKSPALKTDRKGYLFKCVQYYSLKKATTDFHTITNEYT